MKRTTSSPALCLVAAASLTLIGGCGFGNYNPEDLAFIAAIPDKEAVEMQPPGVDDDKAAEPNTGAAQASQALEHECDEDSLRCQAQSMATGFNGISEFLLTVVDAVIQNPPSFRDQGRRIWGPYNDENNGQSFRFEMLLNDDGSFTHCLFLRQGAYEPGLGHGGDISAFSCDTVVDETTGYQRILVGQFIQGNTAGERARSGAGVMQFDANRVVAVTGDDSELLGVFDIQYDNFSEPRTIDIEVTDVPNDEGPIPSGVVYSYFEDDAGAGGFEFAVKGNVTGSATQLETFEINARWRADGAGRAEADISGGDLGPLVWDVTECWDAGLETVYFRDPEPEHPDVGTEDQCVFSALN